MSTIDAQNEFDRNAARVEAESRNQLGTVTIPRAQHEALMAAAKALKEVHGRYLYDIEIREKALVALRAAGIPHHF
jgi:hypothetical protein